MLKNYLKITLRNLFKNRLFVFINVFGLGIALACCIVAYLNWDYNSSWDAYHKDTDDIYRVNFRRITNGRPIQNGSCPMPLAAEMENAFSQVDKMMRYSSVNGDFKIGENVFRTSAAAVDQAFFEVFNFPMQYGSTISLQDQNSILISTELKYRYFPDTDNPIGKSISYINGEDKIPFQVTGVFETPPQNSSFFADAYLHYERAADIFEWNLSNWAAFNTTLSG